MANYREASRGRSKAEFIAKIGDCLKEIEETEYWLEPLVESPQFILKRMAAWKQCAQARERRHPAGEFLEWQRAGKDAGAPRFRESGCVAPRGMADLLDETLECFP